MSRSKPQQINSSAHQLVFNWCLLVLDIKAAQLLLDLARSRLSELSSPALRFFLQSELLHQTEWQLSQDFGAVFDRKFGNIQGEMQECALQQNSARDKPVFLRYLLQALHLLDSAWLARREKCPSYIDILSRLPERFRIISDEWLAIWSSSHLTEADLYAAAKITTPEIANSLLIRGVHIDMAKGPEGQTIWHAVVEYDERPERMLDWLLRYSSFPCHITSSNGNTPLMLAIQLGKVNAAAWLSKHSNLEILNPSNRLTAPELAAKCQTYESVVIFKSIMDNIALDEERGRDLTKRMLRAIWDGLHAQKRRLRIRKLRQGKYCVALAQQHSDDYAEHLLVAEKCALEKFRIISRAIGKPGLV